jgi:hypothetical protein
MDDPNPEGKPPALLVGRDSEAATDPAPAVARLPRVLATPVFADSKMRLMKFCFFGLGWTKPPIPPMTSSSWKPACDFGREASEAWLLWYVTPVNGVSGLSISASRMPIALCARDMFFRARLPALVALMPPAEAPDMRLLFVLCVVVVEVVFVVNVRPSISRPTS